MCFISVDVDTLVFLQFVLISSEDSAITNQQQVLCVCVIEGGGAVRRWLGTL